MSVNNIQKRIGILGGTFDPIHNGHIRLAIEAFEQCRLDAVWFIPDESPPWKSQTQWDINFRVELLEIALENFSHFQIKRIAPENNQPSYSVTTLLTLRNQHPEIDFYWILGSDAFLQIHRWHETELFRNNCRLIVIQRSEYSTDPHNLPSELQHLAKDYCALKDFQKSPIGSWSFFNANIPNISSTMVRQNLAEGKDTRGWISDKIWKQINKK